MPGTPLTLRLRESAFLGGALAVVAIGAVLQIIVHSDAHETALRLAVPRREARSSTP
jgi:hypothetical protein